MDPALTISEVEAAEFDACRDALASIIMDTVEAGGEIGFISPMTRDKADRFWTDIGDSLARRERILLIARLDATVVGTVQIIIGQPENQPHRADLAKMMVAPKARGQGVGKALLAAAEVSARAAGKTLIVLDTAGDASERLYRRASWIFVGRVPGFALKPQGGLSTTNLFYKTLAA